MVSNTVEIINQIMAGMNDGLILRNENNFSNIKQRCFYNGMKIKGAPEEAPLF
jgi:hypothetical protein